MTAGQHADARSTRSTTTRTQRPSQPQQRRTHDGEPHTATLRLPMVTMQVRIPRFHMPQVKLPDMKEAANKIKFRMPTPEETAYFAGLGIMGLLDVLEWPVVLAVGAGTVIAEHVSQQRLASARTRQQTA